MSKDQITGPTGQLSDEEFLGRVRSAYNDYPPHHAQLPFMARPSHKRRRVAVIVASAATVALIPALGAIIATTLSEDGSAPPVGSPSLGNPTASDGATSPSVPGTAEPQLATQLYAVFDAHPAYGFYMLQISASEQRVTLYRSEPDSSVESQVGLIVENAGYSMVIKEMPPQETWSDTDQQALSAAANQMRQTLSDSPESGYADIKIEVPLNTIVLWRTTATRTDDLLQQIADQAGIKLEIRAAPMSESDARSLGKTLRADNERWLKLGFSINGAYATGSGAVVVVTGDETAAHSALSDRSDVFAIEKDDGVPLTGTR
jgi:hypothetical protein